MQLVEKILSKGKWSTTFCRKIFVNTALRRHNTSSKSISSKNFRRHNTSSTGHFVGTTLRRRNISSIQTVRKMRRKWLSLNEMFRQRSVPSTEHFVDEVLCRWNVPSTKRRTDEMLSTKVFRQNVSTKILSTKCFSTKVWVDERHRIHRFSIRCMTAAAPQLAISQPKSWLTTSSSANWTGAVTYLLMSTRHRIGLEDLFVPL
jgi:hypothetical protein